MKSLFSLSMLTAAVLVTTTLTGCATGPVPQQSQKPMGSMPMSSSDMMAMCQDMQTQTTNAKTRQERQAMMAEHMKNMSPEMKQHCQMMMQDQQGSQPTK